MSENVQFNIVEFTSREVGEPDVIEIVQEGPAGPQGPQGDQGIQGIQGVQGDPGADGNTLLSGSGAPSNGLGNDGDFYIDTAAFDIYGPKAGGVWPSGSSLIGATGPQGPTGDGVQDPYQIVAYQASLTLDVNALTSFKVEIELTGNMTLNAPLNPADGKNLKFRFVQDSLGARILTLDPIFRLGTDVVNVILSTGANIVDYMVCEYNANDSKWDVIGFVRGYA